MNSFFINKFLDMLKRNYKMVKNWVGHQARFGIVNSYRFRWRDGINLALLVVIAFILTNKNVQINFSLQNADNETVSRTVSQAVNFDSNARNVSSEPSLAQAANLVSSSNPKPKPKKRTWTRGQKKQLAYVKRFVSVAQAEMKKYDIPASITLAQGLLESKSGESLLAKKNNNHFGVKCFKRRCKKTHCSNFEDDSHKDFFVIYQNAWESYRAHSQLLSGKRYKQLKAHGKDYKAWAEGLQSTGYATSNRYSEKLIRLIEDLELYQYD